MIGKVRQHWVYVNAAFLPAMKHWWFFCLRGDNFHGKTFLLIQKKLTWNAATHLPDETSQFPTNNQKVSNQKVTCDVTVFDDPARPQMVHLTLALQEQQWKELFHKNSCQQILPTKIKHTWKWGCSRVNHKQVPLLLQVSACFLVCKPPFDQLEWCCIWKNTRNSWILCLATYTKALKII